MRPEEILARDCIIKFFNGLATCVQGENPPDFYLTINGVKNAVEVTRLTPPTFDHDGNPCNRISEDEQIFSIVGQIDRDFRDVLPQGLLLGFFVTGPLSNARKFSRDLRAYVKTMNNDPAVVPGWSSEIDLGGNKVLCAAYPPQSDSRRRIVCSVMNDNFRPFVEGNLRYSLVERISDKDKIMRTHPQTIPIWLALVNDTVVGDTASILEVYSNMSHSHCFSRVFLIERNGCTVELIA